MTDLSGKYESKNYGWIEWKYLTLGKSCSRTVGTTLSLEIDSSFNMVTCGNVIIGNWTFDDDSVYLHVKKNAWRNDSLQEFGFNGTWPKVNTKPITFSIHGNELRKYSYSERNGRKHTTFQHLTKTRPYSK